MESLNARVIAGVYDWLSAGERCWLATVVRTYGSSPRPVGSLFAFNPAQGILGSLSGGCVEEDLLAALRAQQGGAAERPRLLRYGVTEEERVRYALPCGGELHILLEDLLPDGESIEHFHQLQQALMGRQPVTRRLNLHSGQARVAIESAEFKLLPDTLVHCLSPWYRMLLVGAGEVAFYVAQFAQALDFQVTLCDPREAFSQGWSVAGVERVDNLPDDLIRARFFDPYCAVLALAHDPRIDDMALMEALTTQAFYVGAMGSQATSQQRLERLASLGLSDVQLARLHAPIGIPIGSKTPAEIAVSVLAHVVAERNRLKLKEAQVQAPLAEVLESRPGCSLPGAILRSVVNG